MSTTVVPTTHAGSKSATMTITTDENNVSTGGGSTDNVPAKTKTLTLTLKAKRKKVQWDSEAIDNEHMNKKSSKSKAENWVHQ
jgi:hypothetical protein